MLRAIAMTLSPLLDNLVYTNQRGLAKGLKRKGGWGFIPRKLLLEDEFLMTLKLQGQTVFDIGGYEGLFTMFFARAVGERGQIVTFEPNPRNYEKVRENAGLNGFSNIRIIEVGLGRERAKATLVFRPYESWRGSCDETAGSQMLREKGAVSIEIEIDTLDNQLAINNLPKPDLVKIDVEGMEADVLSGMTQTIDKYMPKIFVEVHGFTATEDSAMGVVVSFLLDSGYSVHHVESRATITSALDQLPRGGHLYCD